jgi:hypothetical protein
VTSTTVRQAVATVTSAVAGAALVAVLAAVPARAGGAAPLPGPPPPAPAPSRLVQRAPAWDRIGAVLRRAVVAQHPDAAVQPMTAGQDSYLGGVLLSVQYRGRGGGGVVRVDVPPVGQALPPCQAPGDVSACTRTTRFDGGWEELVVYELGGHSPVRLQEAVVVVQRADGVVLTATAAATALPATQLRVLAEQAVAAVPLLSDAGGGWLAAGRTA